MSRLLPLVLSLSLAILGGCGNPEPPPRGKGTSPGKPLLIGLIPEQNVFRQLERYEPLADYLSRKVGIRVKLKVLVRYGNIIDNFKSGGFDGAFFGSFTYALAHNKLGVEVVARPVALDNTSTYHGLIFVRTDSGIRSARDMRGKRFAFVDKATTAGYLLPLAYFREAGIAEYRGFLKEAYFAGTHEDAINDVLTRKADVGAAKNTVYERLARTDPRIDRELTILTRSPEVPENGLALRPDLDEPIRRRIKEALLEMDRTPDGRKVLDRFGALRFIETRDADYAPVYRYAAHTLLNLATYDYVNE